MAHAALARGTTADTFVAGAEPCVWRLPLRDAGEAAPLVKVEWPALRSLAQSGLHRCDRSRRAGYAAALPEVIRTTRRSLHPSGEGATLARWVNGQAAPVGEIEVHTECEISRLA